MPHKRGNESRECRVPGGMETASPSFARCLVRSSQKSAESQQEGTGRLQGYRAGMSAVRRARAVSASLLVG
jgi:hypothetical protein